MYSRCEKSLARTSDVHGVQWMNVKPERLSVLVLNFEYRLALLQVSTRTLVDRVTKTLALLSTDLSMMVPSLWRLVLLPRTTSVELEVDRPCLHC